MSRYFNPYDPYSQNRNKEFAFDTIKELIQSGMKEMRYDISDDSFNVWYDYSQKILELATKDNPTILLNYMRLRSSLYGNNLTPYQKLNACLDYLIKILEAI